MALPRALPDLIRRAAPIGVITLAVIYAIALWSHAGICAAGSDSSGYFNQAKLLTEGRLRTDARVLPDFPMADGPWYTYVPLGFVPEVESNTLVPTYPTGLPLMLAASSSLAGWTHGPTAVLVLHALAGIALTFLLARAVGLHPVTALLAGTLLAVSPLYLMFALQAMSDLPSLVWSTAAVLFAWQAPTQPRRAIMAGAALGIAVLLRPTNSLMFFPVLVALGTSWRTWPWLVLGGLGPAAWQLFINHQAYGHPFATGYGNVGTLFSWEWAPRSLRHYAQWLPAVLSPLVILLLGLPVVFPRHRRAVVVLGVWIVTVLGCYTFYFHTHETWWYLRFVLPAFPALIIGALLVGEKLLRARHPVVRAVLVGLAFALVILNGRHWSRRWDVMRSGEHENAYPRAAAWAQRELPPNAVVVAMQVSGAFHFYTDYTIVRWDVLESRWPDVLAAARRAQRPVYAALFPFEQEEALRDKTPGHWIRLHELGPVTFWRLDAAP